MNGEKFHIVCYWHIHRLRKGHLAELSKSSPAHNIPRGKRKTSWRLLAPHWLGSQSRPCHSKTAFRWKSGGLTIAIMYFSLNHFLDCQLLSILHMNKGHLNAREWPLCLDLFRLLVFTENWTWQKELDLLSPPNPANDGQVFCPLFMKAVVLVLT